MKWYYIRAAGAALVIGLLLFDWISCDGSPECRGDVVHHIEDVIGIPHAHYSTEKK